MDIVTENRQRIALRATLKRLGVNKGFLPGDGIPEMALDTKPPNEAELEKLTKPINDTGGDEGAPSA